MPSSRYTALPQEGRSSLQGEEGDGNGANEEIQSSHESIYPSDLPPEYEPSGEFEEMQIEEEESRQQRSSDFIRSKANRFATDFNRRVVQPLNQALDPVYQLYCYANAQFELYVAKAGNPLIVKRVLFIGLITLLLYFVSLSGVITDGLIGAQSDFVQLSTLEDFIETSLDLGRMEETIEYMSSMPHLSGTAGDLSIASYFQNTIRSSVLLNIPETEFAAYHNYPLNPVVKLFNGDQIVHECNLREQHDGKFENDYFSLAFNPGSKAGNVKGKMVYVNNGELTDYKYFIDSNIDITDKIFIIRYGGKLPAYTKLRYAQNRGAIGVIFISDPSQQQFYTMDSIQRESVAFADILPGNIVSPGLNSKYSIPDNALFDELFNDSVVAPAIPSLPISWRDFTEIMTKLKGKGQHIANWDFTLNSNLVEIWSGSEEFEIELQNELTVRPNKESWNVMGKLAGREQDTFAVIISASRDSVCYGALESSGSAILSELINVFSEMSHTLHWKPLRSIFFVSYSGNKYNMAGSTNFAVQQSDFFKRDVFAYIDLDDIIQGDHLEINGDPVFQSLLRDAVKHILDKNGNDTHVTVADDSDFKYHMSPYSDSIAAINKHGVGGISLKLVNSPSKDLGVAQYYKNSCLDTFKNFKDSHIDPDLSKHAFMTKLVANVLLRLVETPIMPYDIESILRHWNNNLKTVSDTVKRLKSVSGASDELQRIDFAPVEVLLNQMQVIADQNRAFTVTWNDIVDNGKSPEPNLLAVNRWDWNSKVLLFLKVMVSTDGIYQSRWEHNIFYGRELNPGQTVLEDVHNSFPGLWNAINNNDWDGLHDQIGLLTNMLKQGLDLFQY